MKPLLLSSALLLAALPATAQEAASVNWSLTEADGVAVTQIEGDATGLPVQAQTLVPRDYTGTLQDGSAGPLGPYQRWYLNGDEWPVESGPDAARYVEFVAAPEAGASFRVTDVAFVMNAGGTGELDASVFYDTDPAFSNPQPLEVDIDVTRDSVATYSYALDETLASGEAFYLRIYPWLGGGNPSSGRYLFLQDVTIAGESEGAPVEPVDGVTWTLTEADSTTAQAGELLVGDDVRGEGIEIRSYTGALNDGSEGPLGPFQRWWLDANWPDESAPNPERYVEFTASAEAGYGFAVDSVSLIVNGQGTGNLEVSLYYATDPTFSDPVVLAEGLAASRDTLGYASFAVNETVPDGGAFYFRVYPYLPGGSTSEGKYLLLQDVTIAGAAEEIIEVDGVLWSLSASDTTAVTASSENLGGAPVRGQNIEVRNYSDDSDPGVGPFGAFQRWWLDANWPDEAEADPDRYIAFAAGAADGFRFDADSVSLYLNTHGTSNMKATLAYSTSADFADPVVIDDLVLPRKTLGYFEYAIDAEPSDSLYFRIYPYLPGGSTSPGKYVLVQAVTLGGEAVEGSVAAEDGAGPADALALLPAAPNPVRHTATLRYALPQAADVSLDVYDLLGRRVAALVDAERPAGINEATFRTDALAPGLYLVRLQADGAVATQRVTVVR